MLMHVWKQQRVQVTVMSYPVTRRLVRLERDGLVLRGSVSGISAEAQQLRTPTTGYQGVGLCSARLRLLQQRPRRPLFSSRPRASYGLPAPALQVPAASHATSVDTETETPWRRQPVPAWKPRRRRTRKRLLGHLSTAKLGIVLISCARQRRRQVRASP